MDTTAPNPTETKKIQRGRRLYMALAGLGAAALVSSATLSTALAHGHGAKRHGRGHGVMRVLKHAELTDAQEAKIKAIHEKYKPLLKGNRKDRKKMGKGLHSLLTAEKVSAAEAEKLRQEFLDHQEQRSAVMRDMMLDVAKVLTPAQRKKLAQKMEERRKKWEAKRGDREANRGI